MSRRGPVETTYTRSGPRYHVDVWHDELSKYQRIKGDSSYLVEQKAQAKMEQWDQMWERKQATERARHEREQMAQDREQKAALADLQTHEAQAELDALESLLLSTLSIDDTINWGTLKNRKDYSVPMPVKPERPPTPLLGDIPSEPHPTDPKYQPKLNPVDRLMKSRKAAKEEAKRQEYLRDHEEWERIKAKVHLEHEAAKAERERVVEKQEAEFEKVLAEWEEARDNYLQQRDLQNQQIDEMKEEYLEGEPEAVVGYCDMVLGNSQYPDYFPQSYELDYQAESKLLIVDYQLPPQSAIPTVRQVKYIKTRYEFSESHLPQTQFNKLYDGILYQIALRTLHELFEADVIDALTVIVFNGFVDSIDLATGQETTACVLSVQANKEEFEAINLANVDPKACFKLLKGVSSARLYNLTPIAPIVEMSKEDKRFVSSYAVADELGEEYNLAAMDWEDFEHLVREIFEKEFTSTGGEVKVTRASRDGGIDAVAFDPDPIRGGKLVIQAKRYTNTVGVSAVRDLYGSLINEGAAKGILVTTSNYGPDAYDFAKGKPLTLLNGNNLLHLLEKHGYKAKIDLNEAKRSLAGKS